MRLSRSTSGSRRTRAGAIIALALATAACGESRGNTDSTLTRDLSLAGQSNAAAPQLNDTALTSPPAKVARSKRPTTPPTPRPHDTAASAATTTANSPADAAPSSPAPPPAPSQPLFRGIATGATLELRTKSPVCTTNLPGDKITATVAADVSGENGATIPAGTGVVLEVAEVIPGDTPQNARVVLRIRSVLVNDRPVSVPSDVAVTSELERRQVPRDRGADRRKVVGGAVAGAVIGQIMGKNTKSTVTGAVVGAAAGTVAAAGSRQFDACLPAGGSLRATTTQPVALAG